jgi:hypothetical protein
VFNVILFLILEEHGGRGHAAPTPNELKKGQEEEDLYFYTASYRNSDMLT